MRAIIIVICLCIFSCGAKKSAVESSKTNKQTEQEVIENHEVKENLDAEEEVEVKEKNHDSAFVIEAPFESIHTKWDSLLIKHVSSKGIVDYKGFRNDRTKLNTYIKSLSENRPKDSWSKNEKLVYWINTYNALTIDLILRNYPLKSIKDIEKPWNQRLWQFGDKWLNINDIEHEILRKMNEPRIHFAIVCASISCPKLQNKAFTASNIDSQLTKATKEFLNDSTKNDITQNNLRLSKIFKWFAKDFKTKGSLIDFLNTYVDIEISPKAKKSFKDYNWDLND